MSKIITTAEMQRKIGQITSTIGETSYIVTNRGKGKLIILPYFDGCDRFIDDYMEDNEVYKDKEALEKELKESAESGRSDLVI